MVTVIGLPEEGVWLSVSDCTVKVPRLTRKNGEAAVRENVRVRGDSAVPVGEVCGATAQRPVLTDTLPDSRSAVTEVGSAAAARGAAAMHMSSAAQMTPLSR